MISQIQQNLAQLNTDILTLALKYNKNPTHIKLLAVTKTQPVEKILEAIAAGQLSFGENYLQEALPKIHYFLSKNIEWHFIGPIQNNKTKKIAENFSWVHTVNNIKTAERLNNHRPSSLPPLNICLQINISEDKTKSGILAPEVLTLAQACKKLPRLHLRGLMTIPEKTNSLQQQRNEFKKMRLIYELLCSKGFKLDTLSMGMSNDLEAAIAEGTTLLRIGTTIFGQR